MHEGLVANDVGEVVDLSEELRLELLDVLLVPDLGGHQRCTDVDQNAAGEGAGDGVLDVDVHVLQLPAEEVEVAVDGLLGQLALLLELHVDGDAEVFDLPHAGHAFDVVFLALGQDLRLGLIHAEVPLGFELFQAPDDLAHLRLGVGEDEHVVGEGEEVASVADLLQFLAGLQGLV